MALYLTLKDGQLKVIWEQVAPSNSIRVSKLRAVKGGRVAVSVVFFSSTLAYGL